MFWSPVFVVLRILHRRDPGLASPQTASWQDDALAALPLAWLFAAREVLRSVIGHEPPLAWLVGAGAGGALALSVVLRHVRRRPQGSRPS